MRARARVTPGRRRKRFHADNAGDFYCDFDPKRETDVSQEIKRLKVILRAFLNLRYIQSTDTSPPEEERGKSQYWTTLSLISPDAFFFSLLFDVLN